MHVGHGHILCCIICIFWGNRKLPGTQWSKLKKLPKNNPALTFLVLPQMASVHCVKCLGLGPRSVYKLIILIYVRTLLFSPGCQSSSKKRNGLLSYWTEANSYTNFKDVQLDTNILFAPTYGEIGLTYARNIVTVSVSA